MVYWNNRNFLDLHPLHRPWTVYDVCFTMEAIERENWLQNTFSWSSECATHILYFTYIEDVNTYDNRKTVKFISEGLLSPQHTSGTIVHSRQLESHYSTVQLAKFTINNLSIPKILKVFPMII